VSIWLNRSNACSQTCLDHVSSVQHTSGELYVHQTDLAMYQCQWYVVVLRTRYFVTKLVTLFLTPWLSLLPPQPTMPPMLPATSSRAVRLTITLCFLTVDPHLRASRPSDLYSAFVIDAALFRTGENQVGWLHHVRDGIMKTKACIT
jgi:hypothetical protein